MKLTYNVWDKDYDFTTYNYCFMTGEIIALDGNNKIGTIDYQIDFLDFNFNDDVELDWEMGYPMDPDAEGDLQATVVDYKKILEKRKVSLCDSDNGDFENPETLLTTSQAAEKLGCTEEEFNATLKSVCEEAERYLVKSLQSFADNLEYVDNYEPDYYDYYEDWRDLEWDIDNTKTPLKETTDYKVSKI